MEGRHNLEKNIFNFLKIVVDSLIQGGILDMKVQSTMELKNVNDYPRNATSL
jgi:hypothetical protein